MAAVIIERCSRGRQMTSSDWTRVRARWEALHGIRSILFLTAVGLLAAALHVA
jgi:hypothetical protein